MVHVGQTPDVQEGKQRLGLPPSASRFHSKRQRDAVKGQRRLPHHSTAEGARGDNRRAKINSEQQQWQQ